ncbi:MAG: hypothetical protein L0271_14195 [Gemmatimonadetes bacterium]|nr:hypothetical protein [Gemmatimonadota bacterium]
MEPVIVVTHGRPLRVTAREFDQSPVTPNTVALGYFVGDNLIARGVVANSAVDTLQALLREPVMLALAADEDEAGNIDARVCIVVRIDPSTTADSEPDEEPWRASVPAPPFESAESGETQRGLALIPLGDVVRSASNRTHDELAGDVREMLANLLHGRSRDAVEQAIDDLLNSI